MAFYRRRYKKRTYKRRRNYKKSQKIFQRKVKRVMDKYSEKKNVDSNQTGAANTVTTIFSLGMDGLPQGTTMNTRVGNDVYIRSCTVNGVLTLGDATNYIRVTLLQWKKDTASLTTGQQVYYNNSLAGYTYLSQFAKEYAGDFKVIKDRTFRLDSVNVPTLRFKWFCTKGFAKNLRYNSQVAGNLLVKNALVLLVTSDSAVGPNPTIAFESRINYNDI